MREWIRRVRQVRSDTNSPEETFVLRLRAGIALATLILILSLFG